MALRWRIAQFFEINWWRQYLQGIETGEYLAWKTRYWNDFLEKGELQVPPGASALDAGCGPAGIFTVLKTRETDALDPLLLSYERSLAHFRRSDYPGVRFICLPLERFFPEKQYDVVFCLNAINHVEDIPACADRLAALVKTDGVLALSIDAHRFSLLKRLFRLLPVDILHPHQYDVAEYRDMLTSRGFRIERAVLLKKGLIFDYYLLVARSSVAAHPSNPALLRL